MEIEFEDCEPNPWMYKSVFKDGRLYMNSTPFLSELAFFEDLMTKGPQIYSQIDKWMLEDQVSVREMRRHDH